MSALRMGWPNRYLLEQSLRWNLRATLGGSGESEPCLVSILGSKLDKACKWSVLRSVASVVRKDLGVTSDHRRRVLQLLLCWLCVQGSASDP